MCHGADRAGGGGKTRDPRRNWASGGPSYRHAAPVPPSRRVETSRFEVDYVDLVRAKREEVLKAIYAAFEARDRRTVEGLLAPDFEFHSATGLRVGRTGPYIGHDGFAEYLADVDRLWAELRLRVDSFEHSESKTLCVGRAWARSDSAVIDSPTGWIWEFAEGTEVPRTCTVFEDLVLALETFGA